MDTGSECFFRYIGGDESGFDELIHLYRESLTAFVSGYVRSRAEAEDIAADVFVELIVHPDKFDPARGSIKTYMYSIARSRALDFLRRIKRGNETAISTTIDCNDTILDIPDLAHPSPEAEYITREEQTERAEALRSAMASIKEEYRTVLRLVYYENMSYSEAGEVMHKTSKQTDNLVFRAKHALKKAMSVQASDYSDKERLF
ncbi:ECF RNA polymerase sigma factor SigM [bioreactor metagenome]|uniref:ECF RNA polymerase sigma factor SigM n=1 Tax=bioreactor metagenome TaxID=1076179 RepID=A0A645C9Y3_9ZZZZ|nr:RNA polymerase sigma factor [Oscillospiraceae bacterium]